MIPRTVSRIASPALRASRGATRRGFIIRTAQEVKDAGDVHVASTGTWESRRYLKRKDGLGFSFHHTVLYAGSSTLIWYKNHVEAVIVTHGAGEIEVVEPGQKEGEGKVYKLDVGTCYALNGQERHYLRAYKDADMHVICAFNPPIAGSEDHNEEGVYPAVDDEGKQYHSYESHDLPKLIKPPASLQEGSA
eukprot:CAMPEP_0196780102 /NCGR_PEP_ID=MMETSP1104-20130614/7121_1 /TAXON_ID=33652 /ORGANISM="Cafeteria sp., Strain Caron Lab Isolate" /LENGTH=190 /DNA_ID=CAMNT_0042150293 /DNA_START=11 /DNA_END=583 /DNA_ORIENTATION=+